MASFRALPQDAWKLAGPRNTRVWFASRNLHADALEWLWFVNSHSEVIYKLMYGDKDTFRLAFALAGKSDYYEQVPYILPSPSSDPKHPADVMMQSPIVRMFGYLQLFWQEP